MKRPYRTLHQFLQCGGRISNFPGHELAVPGGNAFTQNTQEKRVNKRSKLFLRCRFVSKAQIGRLISSCQPQRMFEDGYIEPFFVPEMVVHSGDIYAGTAAYFSHRRRSKSMESKHLPGSVDQPCLCVIILF